MNTPSHAIVNCALLGRLRGVRAGWILAFSVLPDLPILLFYLQEKLLARAPEAQIWNHDYFISAWQPVIDALHSFPLIALALVLLWRWPTLRAAAAAMLLHSLGDFPLHHDDAHRHFFPFSDWRFRSPLSYWDPAHHGLLGATVEIALVLAALAVLARRSGLNAEKTVGASRRLQAVRWCYGLTALLYLALYAIILRHHCASPLFHPRLFFCGR